MHIVKTQFFKLGLLSLFVFQTLTAPPAFAQSANGPNSSGGVNPPLDGSQSQGTFPLFDIPDNTFDPSSAEDPNSPESKSLDLLEGAAPQVIESQQQWADEREKEIQPLIKMREKLFIKAAKDDLENGVEDTDELINSGNEDIELPGYGKMKLTYIDGKRIAVFFDEKTDRATIIIHNDELAKDSEHLQLVIKKYHVLGGNEGGRDATLMFLNEDMEVKDVVRYDKLQKWTKEWWQEQKDGKLEAPTGSTISMGLVTGGLAQGAATYLVSSLKYHVLGQHDAMDWFPMAFTFGWASMIGAFAKSYWNIAYTGTEHAQSLKQIPVSVGFTLVMLAHAGHIGSIKSVSFWATLAAVTYVKKSISSVPWTKIVKFRTNLRENAGKFWFTTWNKSLTERNLFYLIPFIFTNLDIFFAKYETIPHLHFGVPVSMLSGAVLARWLYLNYLKSLANRPISKKWPNSKANKVKKELTLEQGKWDRMWDVTTYPGRLKNQAIEFKDSSKDIYKKSTEYSPIANLADAILNKCNLALETYGLKKKSPFTQALKY